jgi:hypothetical protein
MAEKCIKCRFYSYFARAVGQAFFLSLCLRDKAVPIWVLDLCLIIINIVLVIFEKMGLIFDCFRYMDYALICIFYLHSPPIFICMPQRCIIPARICDMAERTYPNDNSLIIINNLIFYRSECHDFLIKENIILFGLS